jgi:hypothetical protein
MPKHRIFPHLDHPLLPRINPGATTIRELRPDCDRASVFADWVSRRFAYNSTFVLGNAILEAQ